MYACGVRSVKSRWRDFWHCAGEDGRQEGTGGRAGKSIAYTHPAGMLATLKADGLLSPEEFRIISALLQQQRQRHRVEAAAEAVTAKPPKR